MFSTYKKQGKPKIVIAGPYEFLADALPSEGASGLPVLSTPLPPAEEGRRALKAHSLLQIDIGWLSPRAAGWLKESAGKTPPGYLEVGAEPLAHIVNTRIGKVGVLLFPQGPIPGRAPTPEQEQSVLAAGRALQAKTSLVLGVSPWGLVGEKKFLPKAQGIFACILGGGEGVGFAQSLTDQTPGVLWLRPDAKGRAVNILELLEMPQFSPSKSGASPKWIEGVTFRASLEFLDDAFPSDPAMQKTIGPPPAPK